VLGQPEARTVPNQDALALRGVRDRGGVPDVREHEVPVALVRPRVQLVVDVLAGPLHAVDGLRDVLVVVQRGEAGAAGDGARRERRLHASVRVRPRRRRQRVAEPKAREPVRLRERSQHGDVLALVQQRDRRRRVRELAVRLVHDDQRVLVGLVGDFLDGVQREPMPSGVVRAREVDDALAVVRVQHALGGEREPVLGADVVLGNLSVVEARTHPVVRESGRGDEHAVPGCERRPSEVVERAVAAVRQPHLLVADVPLVGERGGEVGVDGLRVAVDLRGGLADGGLGLRTRAVGVLVRGELHELRRVPSQLPCDLLDAPTGPVLHVVGEVP